MQELKFENGKLVVRLSGAVDADKDGKKSVEAEASIKIDAAEAVSEIARKDLPWLEAIISQHKA